MLEKGVLTRWSSIFCLCAPLALTAAPAAAEPTGLQGRELSAGELAGMRGKFVAGGQLAYFGILLHSYWEDPQGALRHGGVALQVDWVNGGGDGLPKVNLFMLGELLIAGEAAEGVVALPTTGTGLDNVEGVAQGIQVAGDGNHVTNDIRVDAWVTSSDAVTSLAELEGVLLQQSGSTSFLSEDGGVTTATVADNGLGLAITVPGQGVVLQQIQGGSGVLQSTQLQSDLNTIRNLIQLDAAWVAPAGESLALPALKESLRGLPL